MPMEKLDNELIKKINSYSEDKSNTEIWKELWLHRSTVWKYRKDIADTLKDKLSKWDKKKLQLLEHYTDKDIQEMLNYIAQNTKKEVNEVLSEPWHLKFALLSDTHFGAKQCAKDELWEFYDRAKDKWVEAFVHCGDIVDGSDVYKGQQFEQSEVWFSNQLQDITQNYPNVWIPTYFIWWNHDEAYLKGNWVNICKAIETVRQDLINLWFYDARLRLNWIDINLHHWGGSLSYAKDYKMKKYLDSLPVEWQPDIFALWHYHTALYDLHRWIHGFMPGAFLKENLLAKRFNLDNTIWGWIIEIDKNEKGQSKLNMEFIKL
jgi:predicted phosphodiesterase